MKYTCKNCIHYENGNCTNRDSDLWNMETSPDDTCLDCEPKGDEDGEEQ